LNENIKNNVRFAVGSGKKIQTARRAVLKHKKNGTRNARLLHDGRGPQAKGGMMADQIRVVSYLDKNDIIDFLQDSMDHEEIVEWIQLLDESIADWDVTVALFRHFREQKRIFDKESKVV
jgi:hypothetical protein